MQRVMVVEEVEEVEVVMEGEPFTHDQAPTSAYVNALAKLESTQRHKEKTEKDLEYTQNTWNTRNEIASRLKNGKKKDELREKTMRFNLDMRKKNFELANKSNKKAEDRFIAMFLEAVEVYLDVIAEGSIKRDRYCIAISTSLEEFFRKVGNNPNWKQLVGLVVGRDSNYLCLDHIIRSNAVPTALKRLIESSELLGLLETKAKLTDGWAEDVAGGVLAIDMFELDKDQITMLHNNARNVYTELAIRWMLGRELVLSERNVSYEKKWSFVPDVKEGSDDGKNTSPARRGYELKDHHKRKLVGAREMHKRKTSLYWTFAYMILMIEKGGKKVDEDSILPLSKWEKEGAETIYKIMFEQQETREWQPDQETGGNAFSAAPPESSGADFRF